MVRPLRIEYPGALYHITSRGNSKQQIFFSETDRVDFIETLEHVARRYNWVCYAYCLMGNHYHLLIETIDPTLSRGMRDLNGIYTQKFNKRHENVGHLLQGRFHTFVIEKETYLLGVARYVVLNPVRAGLVKQPEDWKWSSYRATAGLEEAPSFLDEKWLLSLFGENRSDAINSYRDFVHMEINEASPFDTINEGIALGSPQFIQNMWEKTKDIPITSEIQKGERIIGRLSLHDLFDDIGKNPRERNNAIIKAVSACGYSNAEVARHLGISNTLVSLVIAGKKTL